MRQSSLAIALCLDCFEGRAQGVQASESSSGPANNAPATLAATFPAERTQPVILRRFDKRFAVSFVLRTAFVRLGAESRPRFLCGPQRRFELQRIQSVHKPLSAGFTGMAGSLSRLPICSGEAFDQPLHISQEGESNENQTIPGAL